VARDVSDHRELEGQRDALVEACRALASEIELSRLLPLLVKRAADLMKADGALLFLLEGEQFAIEATTGVPEGLRAMGGLSRTESRIGRILQSGQPSAVENMEADPEWRLEFLARRFGYRGMMAVPVIAQGEPLGVLKLVFYQPHPVIPGALRLL
jgi:transcriptional regulator with GAF, ATPase, and Fis domain